MHDVAKLKAYKIDSTGTTLQIFIKGKNLDEYINKKNVREIGITLDDGRTITTKQRMKAYATIEDIAIWSGYLPEEVKELMKYEHIARTGCEYFSLGTCSIDTAREFINTLIDFCLQNGIMLADKALERTDDIGKYLYMCIKYRKCCVCGIQNSDIHHVDTIGMGYDRSKVDDSNYRKMCLCRTHHTEFHTIGSNSFYKKYKVYGIVYEE